MSRKNKYLRAVLSQNPNPTNQELWDAAWKHAQKTFHARSMQDMRADIDRLKEGLREALRWADDHPAMPSTSRLHNLLEELDRKGSNRD